VRGYAGTVRQASTATATLIGLGVLCVALLFSASPVVAAPSTWQATPSPSRAGNNELNGVSCASANFCAAVGDYFNSHAGGSMIDMWDGQKWSLTPSPSPGQEPHPGTLNSVSCPSANFCVAVGYYDPDSISESTLIEIWNGKRWSVSPSPSPGNYNHLLGVSCSSPTDCEAVGFHLHTCAPHVGGGSGLVERWNGHDWTVNPSPRDPCTGDTELHAVACTSASNCTAVGQYSHGSSGDRTLVESWNGSSWSVVSSPNGNPTNNNELFGISCADRRSCVAVGQYQLVFAGPALTLTETWNGTTWSVVTSPSPGTPNASDSLTSVSCTGSTNCVAVGDKIHVIGTTPFGKTLIETWDGVMWSTTASPNPLNSQVLNGVVCISGSSCEAVGDGGSDTDTPHHTLVETGS
jgi:hypothetical protein